MNNLSEDLRSWRAERPDEWQMDTFARAAKKLEAELQSTTQELNTAVSLVKLRDKKIAELEAFISLYSKCEYCKGVHPDPYGCHEWVLMKSEYIEKAIKEASK